MAEQDHFDAEAFQAVTNVSRETLERLKAFDALFLTWTSRVNLVARSTIPVRWHRHYWDSAQLLPLMPKGAKQVLDLGSGGGFPGLLLALLSADEPAPHFWLVESTARKCAFLTEAVQALSLKNVTILNNRIEAVRTPKTVDLITARALTALPGLLAYAHPFMGPQSVCLFQKGKNADQELTKAAAHWTMDVIPHISKTDAQAKILEIRKLSPCPRPKI